MSGKGKNRKRKAGDDLTDLIISDTSMASTEKDDDSDHNHIFVWLKTCPIGCRAKLTPATKLIANSPTYEASAKTQEVKILTVDVVSYQEAKWNNCSQLHLNLELHGNPVTYNYIQFGQDWKRVVNPQEHTIGIDRPFPCWFPKTPERLDRYVRLFWSTQIVPFPSHAFCSGWIHFDGVAEYDRLHYGPGLKKSLPNITPLQKELVAIVVSFLISQPV